MGRCVYLQISLHRTDETARNDGIVKGVPKETATCNIDLHSYQMNGTKVDFYVNVNKYILEHNCVPSLAFRRFFRSVRLSFGRQILDYELQQMCKTAHLELSQA